MENLGGNMKRLNPFVGGESAYLEIKCTKAIINDKYDKLKLLYKLIKNHNFNKFILAYSPDIICYKSVLKGSVYYDR